MKRLWKIFCIAYPVSFPVAFLLQRHLEQTGNSDGFLHDQLKCTGYFDLDV
jgi:hypothetical protein